MSHSTTANPLLTINTDGQNAMDLTFEIIRAEKDLGGRKIIIYASMATVDHWAGIAIGTFAASAQASRNCELFSGVA